MQTAAFVCSFVCLVLTDEHLKQPMTWLIGMLWRLNNAYTLNQKKVKADIALHGNPISELRDVTCHMGSHSVTCHPTQVNTPRLNPSHAGWYSIYLPRRDGRLSWPSWPDSAPARSRTSDLLITSPTLNHCTTKTTWKWLKCVQKSRPKIWWCSVSSDVWMNTVIPNLVRLFILHLYLVLLLYFHTHAMMRNWHNATL